MTTHQATRIIRLAWLLTFVVPLLLATLLLVARSANAAPPASAATEVALDEEFEAEAEAEGEFEEFECEEAELALEEEEVGEAEFEKLCEKEAKLREREEKKAAASGSTAAAPEECVLRSANARLVAYASHDDVRLTIGYTTYEPATATIDFRLLGGKGSLHLGTVHRHLGRSGVIRLTESLTDAKMTRVDAAGHFVVKLHVPGSPSSCKRFETEQLSVKHASKSQAVWSQAG